MRNRLLARIIGTALFLIVAQLAAAPVATAATTLRPQIALCFDDGPTAGTPQLLSILAAKKAKATFFFVGENVEAYPAEAFDAAAAGMLIGNHTYDHADVTSETTDAIYADIQQAQTVITSYCGVTPHWYRSPFNSWNPAYNTVLPELGLKISWATIDPQDWSDVPPASIIATVMANAAAGATVELHDQGASSNTLDALPDLIDDLRAAGYDLVTLDDTWQGAIEGTVSANGEPAAGAVAEAYAVSDNSLVATALVGDDGTYRIGPLPADAYHVEFVDAGYPSRFYGGASIYSATDLDVAPDYAIAGVGMALGTQDVTPPSTAISGVSSGWVTHDVTFGLSATDADSPDLIATYYGLNGPADTPYSSSVTVSSEGTTTVAYYSVDFSGNAETPNTTVVRIDKTPPQVGDDHVAQYDDAATIHISATDAVSGVAAITWTLDGTPGSGPTVTTSQPGTHTLDYTVADAAGNTAGPVQVVFHVADLTPPVTSVGGLPSGWVNHAVTLTLSAVDTGTPNGISTFYGIDGPATTPYGGPISVTTQGVTTVSYRSVDAPGNQEATRTATVRIDTTPPTITGSLMTTPTPCGWCRTPAVVHFSAADALSGLSSVTPDRVIASDGASQSVTGIAVDEAGNTATVTVSGIDVDCTPPKTTDDHVASYTGGAVVHLTATDTFSGVATTTWTLNGHAGSGTLVQSSTVGTNTLQYRSIDHAGNVEDTRTVTFAVAALHRATKLALSGVSGIMAGGTYKLTGSISPTTAGGTVTIRWQRLVGRTWVTSKTVRVTIAKHAFSYALRLTMRGKWRAAATYGGQTIGASIFGPSSATRYFTVR